MGWNEIDRAASIVRRTPIASHRNTRPLRSRASAAVRRRNAENRKALALIVAYALCVAGTVAGAAMVDNARGISLGESLSSAGL